MKAVLDRVFIKLQAYEKKQGGVLLPDSFENQKNVGEVLNVGPEVKSVKIGDIVFFHAFDELPTLKKNVVVVRERSLLAVLEKKDC